MCLEQIFSASVLLAFCTGYFFVLGNFPVLWRMFSSIWHPASKCQYVFQLWQPKMSPDKAKYPGDKNWGQIMLSWEPLNPRISQVHKMSFRTPKKGKVDPAYLIVYWILHQECDLVLKLQIRGSPGGPVVRTQHFHCQGPGSIPGQGTKISQVVWLSTPTPKS